MPSFYTASTPTVRDELKPIGLDDLPYGRGPFKVVDTNNLRDPDDSDPPLNVISGARMTGYYGVRTDIPFDTVQEALDYLGEGYSLPIIAFQEDTSGGIPSNTGSQRFLVVTTPGSGASIGDLLFDNGLNTGTMTIVPSRSGRVISVTRNLTGGTIEFVGDRLYQWDNSGSVWNEVGGGAGDGTSFAIVRNQANTSGGIPSNTGTARYLAVTTAGSGAVIGDLLFDDGSGVGTMTIVPRLNGRVISTTQALTGGTIELEGDALYEWDGSSLSWLLTTRNSFLAPNEFYVDTDRIAAGNLYRWVGTLEDAIAAAEAEFAPGIEVVIRLREGQAHTTAAVTFPSSRSWTVYAAAAQSSSNLAATVGSLTLAGPATSLGAPAASLPTISAPAVALTVEFRGITLLGGLYGASGWDVIYTGVAFGGFNHTLDENGGVGYIPRMVVNDCGFSRDFAGPNQNPLRVETVNVPGAGTRASMTFTRTTLSLFNTSVSGGPAMTLSRAEVSFLDCVIDGKVDGGAPAVLVDDPVGFTNSILTQGTTIELSVADAVTQAAVFHEPLSLTASGLTLRATCSSPGAQTWSLSDSKPSTTIGTVQVVSSTIPPNRAQTPEGTVYADKQAYGPLSNVYIDPDGAFLTAGSYVYGYTTTPGAAPTAIPQFLNGSLRLLAPDRIVRWKTEVVAKGPNGGALVYGLWTFEGFQRRSGAGFSNLDGPNKVAVVTSGGTLDANINYLAGPDYTIEIEATGVAATAVEWRTRTEWFVL